MSRPDDNAPPVPASMMQPGEMAPDVTLLDHADNPVTLSELRGHRVVLFFYPRDSASECTIEALEFSTLLDAFAEQRTLVYGISPDLPHSHRKFREKYGLRVPLLADPELVAQISFGAWGPRELFGQKFNGTLRSTFLIDSTGRIERAWPTVQVTGHARQVLDVL